MTRWEEPSSDDLRRFEDYVIGEMARMQMVREKKVNRLFDRMIELDIFREMPDPPCSYHFSHGFREWYNRILMNKIAETLEANPEAETINHELHKPEMISAMIEVYIQHTSPGKSVTKKEMKELTKAVGAILLLQDERRAKERLVE